MDVGTEPSKGKVKFILSELGATKGFDYGDKDLRKWTGELRKRGKTEDWEIKEYLRENAVVICDVCGGTGWMAGNGRDVTCLECGGKGEVYLFQPY